MVLLSLYVLITSIDVVRREVALGKNPNLQKLEFGSPAAFGTLYETDDVSFAWIPELLAQVTSPYISEVGFWLWEGDVYEMASTSWDEISTILHSSQFSSLKKLAFHVSGRNPALTSQIASSIKDRFVRFEERGLLHIDSTPDPACA